MKIQKMSMVMMMAVATAVASTTALAEMKEAGTYVPYLAAKMEVKHAEGVFRKGGGFQVSMGEKVGEQGMFVEFSYWQASRAPQLGLAVPVSQLFVVEKSAETDCGSTIYLGTYGGAQGVRGSIEFVDHSTRVCEDFRPFRWEVRVRQGFGWCGTGDSIVELMGNPEPVFVTM